MVNKKIKKLIVLPVVLVSIFIGFWVVLSVIGLTIRSGVLSHLSFNYEKELYSKISTSTKKSSVQKKKGWLPIKEMLASTPLRREKAAINLGINEGRFIIALLSTECDDCDKVAKDLNTLQNLDRVVVIVADTKERAAIWQQRLGLKYRIISVTPQVFDDLGAVLLPTIVLMQDGKSIGVSEEVFSKTMFTDSV